MSKLKSTYLLLMNFALIVFIIIGFCVNSLVIFTTHSRVMFTSHSRVDVYHQNNKNWLNFLDEALLSAG